MIFTYLASADPEPVRHVDVFVTFLRFIMPGDVDLDDLPYEDLLSDDEELEIKKEREKRKRQELLAKVDFTRYGGFTTSPLT